MTLEHRPAGSEEMTVGICGKECSRSRVASPTALRQEHCGGCGAESVSWEGDRGTSPDMTQAVSHAEDRMVH